MKDFLITTLYAMVVYVLIILFVMFILFVALPFVIASAFNFSVI